MTAVAGLDRRRRGLALVVAAALLMVLGGWLSTLVIESPREAAAGASPPAPSLIAVPVERRQVGEEVVTRGRVTARTDVEAINELAGAQAHRAVVSGRLPRPGQQLKAGQVAVEISGRPIFVLTGAVPAYRDLGPGAAGGDVRQLNRALALAGFSTEAASTSFSETTRTAVDALYRRSGYTSNGTLPAAEVVFVSTMPATVSEVRGTLGSEAGSASIRLTSGDLVVVADLGGDRAALVQPGTEVEVTSEVLGTSVEATVTAAVPGSATSGAAEPEDPTGTASTSDSTSEIVIAPKRRLSGDWVGQDVRVRILGAITATKVLAVPVTAVVSNGSGSTEVVVVDAHARSIGEAHPRRIQVTTGATGGGWVEVRPLHTAIRAGDLVQLSAPTGRRTP